ncbi:hypothetical protein JXQ70_15955 [bacterium]|nr:hypothetical protein [bacterium]
MKMLRNVTILFVLCCIVGSVCLVNPALADKKRIAVVRFDNKSGYGAWELGWSAADMMMTKLFKSDKFTLIERAQLEAILNEQGLGQSGVITPQTAAQVGKVLGVSAVVIGTVSAFSIDEGGSSFYVGSYHRTTAKCTIDVRIVDTSSAEILFMDTASSSADDKSVKVYGIGKDRGYNESFAEKTLRGAIDELGDKIVAHADKISSGGAGSLVQIALLKDGKVYINVGSSSDTQVGDTYTVKRQGEQIIDPVTGQSLGAETTVIGKIMVTSIVNEKLSICTVKSGSGFKKGDLLYKD